MWPSYPDSYYWRGRVTRAKGAPIQTLLFSIAPERVAAYRAWRVVADYDYLRAQLEQQGWAHVVRLGDARGLARITTLPAPGAAEPFYGTLGGGFPFSFRPFRTSCQLSITAPPLSVRSGNGEIRALPPVAAPLELVVEPMALLDAPLSTPGGHGVLDDCPDDPHTPWHFGISGPLIAQLAAWGWDRAVPAAYSYAFTPTNVGCIVRVADERAGTTLDLTPDGDW